jgi:hypothetical protein
LSLSSCLKWGNFAAIYLISGGYWNIPARNFGEGLVDRELFGPDVFDAKRLQAGGMFFHITLCRGFVLKQVDAAGLLGFRVFGPDFVGVRMILNNWSRGFSRLQG